MATYLITATDDLLISKKLKEVSGDAETRSFYADEADLNALASSISTLNLFEIRSCYLVKEVKRLSLTKRTEKLLTRLVSSTPEETKLIFTQEMHFDGEYAERMKFQESKLFKLLKDLVDKHINVAFGVSELKRWVLETALVDYGLVLGSNQIDVLVSSCRELPSLIDAELKKLSLLKTRTEPQSIPNEYFERVVTKTVGNVFNDIRDLILRKDLKALPLLFEIYKREPIGFELMRDLYRNLQSLYVLKTDGEGGKLRAVRGISDYRRRFLLEIARRWSLDALVRAKALITETEFRHRTGRSAGKSLTEAERDLIALMVKSLVSL